MAALVSFAFSVSTGVAKCRISDFAEANSGASAIFLGTVVEETVSGDFRYFAFDVDRVWKGSRSARIVVGFREFPGYGAWFRKDEKYLVYASLSGEKLVVGRCSRSQLAEYSANDMKMLGRGRKPVR